MHISAPGPVQDPQQSKIIGEKEKEVQKCKKVVRIFSKVVKFISIMSIFSSLISMLMLLNESRFDERL